MNVLPIAKDGLRGGFLALASNRPGDSASVPHYMLIIMPKLAHHVFFTLTDRSDSARQNLVNACKKYLDGHDGVVDFSVGTRETELNRPVNVDYDVSLHVIFADRESHDVYQTAPRHLQFIEENKPTWAQVQVFDSNLC